MFSADIFAFVENFLGAATSFVNSFFVSIYLLIRYPRAAPRLLQRRLKDEKTRQIGPLTFHFLIIFSIVTPPVLFDDTSFFKNIGRLLDDSEKGSVIACISAALAATAMIDAVARLVASYGWPRKPQTIPRYRRREKYLVRKTMAAYALVFPTLLAALSLVASLAYVVALWSGKLGFVFAILPLGNVGFYAAFIGLPLLLLIVLQQGWRSSFLTSLYARRSDSRLGRLLLRCAKVLTLPVLLVAVLVVASFTLDFAKTIYPPEKLASLAGSKEIAIHDVECSVRDAQTVMLSLNVFNKAKGPAIVTPAKYLTVEKPTQQGEIYSRRFDLTIAEIDRSASRAIVDGESVRTLDVRYSGTLDAIAAGFECRTVFYVEGSGGVYARGQLGLSGVANIPPDP